MVYFRKKSKEAESVDRSQTWFISGKRVTQLKVLIGVTQRYFGGKFYNMVTKTVDRSPT